mgnify:CR=1 FL=1
MVKHSDAVPTIRPPQVVNKTSAIARADAWTRRRLQRNLAKLMELAEGVLVAAPAPKGEKPRQLILRDLETGKEEVVGIGLVVYRQQPSLVALQYLVDRGMGKVPSRLEITGNEGGPVAVIPWRPALEAANGNYLDAEFTELDVQGQVEGGEGEAAGRARGDSTNEPQADPEGAAEVYCVTAKGQGDQRGT